MERMRHGYSHDTRGDGMTVVKRYVGPDAERRGRTERAALLALAGLLPVPRVIPDRAGPVGKAARVEGALGGAGPVAPPAGLPGRPGGTGGGDLIMAHMPGVHGQELIDDGHAGEVLWACGAMLRRIQELDPASVFGHERGAVGGLERGAAGEVEREAGGGRKWSAGAGCVVVHGDYGPNNMLFDPGTFEVAAVLDWEWARVGDPVDDLAWCEWIVRMHHPGVVGALGWLFEGYGRRPAWEERQRARVERCRQLVRVVGGDEAAVAVWRERLAVTAGWGE